MVNPNADDKKTWLPVGDGFMPVRAMIHSWKPAMEAFSAVWHSGGQVVVINDHSNRLDMMEFVDGIYAEMGDMSAAGSSALGSLNAHGIGTAFATLGPMVNYIWNHPKKEASMTEAYTSAGLMTHLYAGVFPTVPIKNNDHALGGDCAPGCDYSKTFAAYGKLFDAIRGRRWVLDVALPAQVTTGNALANLFRTDDSYVAVVSFAPLSGKVGLMLRGLDLACATPASVRYLAPGNQAAVTGKVGSIATGAACDGGWGDGASKCMPIELVFDGRGGNVTSSVVLVTISC